MHSDCRKALKRPGTMEACSCESGKVSSALCRKLWAPAFHRSARQSDQATRGMLRGPLLMRIWVGKEVRRREGRRAGAVAHSAGAGSRVHLEPVPGWQEPNALFEPEGVRSDEPLPGRCAGVGGWQGSTPVLYGSGVIRYGPTSRNPSPWSANVLRQRGPARTRISRTGGITFQVEYICSAYKVRCRYGPIRLVSIGRKAVPLADSSECERASSSPQR